MGRPHTCDNAGETLIVPIDGSDTFALTLAIFCAPTCVLTEAHTPAQAPANTLDLLGKYTDENLYNATKLALELFV